MRLVILIITLSISAQMHAQHVFHVGTLHFLGDMGGNGGVGGRGLKDFNFRDIGIQIGYSRIINKWSININVGEFRGDDRKIKDQGGGEIWRLQRGYHFKALFIEGYLARQWTISIFYAKPGIGIVTFYPVPRKPEGISYSKVTPVASFAAGLEIGNKLGLEINTRFVNTDYLDGRKYSVNPKNRDGYVSVSLWLKLVKDKNYKLKCPKY